MKKFYLPLFAAASMMFAVTSCSQEEDFGVSSSDMTTFSVSLNGPIQSRAGEGSIVNKLYYAVYQGEGEERVHVYPKDNENNPINGAVSLQNLSAEVPLPILKGETYDIIFWAQNDQNGIYDISNLTSIGVNYNATLSNKEEYDAFYNALNDFKADNKGHKVELRRPFAQLNLGTSDWDTAKQALKDNNTDPVTHSQVVVKGLANAFAPLTGVASGNEEATFNAANITKETFDLTIDNETKTYTNLSLNYLLVPCEKAPQGTGEYVAISTDEKALVDVTYTLYRGEGNVLFEMEKIGNVPVQRNYRTNIVGE